MIALFAATAAGRRRRRRRCAADRSAPTPRRAGRAARRLAECDARRCSSWPPGPRCGWSRRCWRTSTPTPAWCASTRRAGSRSRWSAGTAAGPTRSPVRVGELLGAQPVVTTATDATRLDRARRAGRLLGRRGGRAISPRPARRCWTGRPRAARPARVRRSRRCRRPATEPRHTIVDHRPARSTSDGAGTSCCVPPSLVVGVGASRGVPADEVLGARRPAARRRTAWPARRAGLRAASTLKADEAGHPGAAARGWPLRTYPAAALAAVDVPNPSEVVRAEVGTPERRRGRRAARGRRARAVRVELVVEKTKGADGDRRRGPAPAARPAGDRRARPRRRPTC